MFKTTIVSILLLLVTLPTHSALYRWVDENGLVHFSDKRPPKTADAAVVTLDVQRPSAANTAPARSIVDRARAITKKSNTKKRKKRQVTSTVKKASSRTSTSTRSSTY